MRFSRTKFAHAAFALIEITLVIAIIALLATMPVPSFLGARKRSQASQGANRHRLIDSAAKRYETERGETSSKFIDV